MALTEIRHELGFLGPLKTALVVFGFSTTDQTGSVSTWGISQVLAVIPIPIKTDEGVYVSDTPSADGSYRPATGKLGLTRAGSTSAAQQAVLIVGF